MSDSDSMFLFDILVENLTSYIDCKRFNIQIQFADVFKVFLGDPYNYNTKKKGKRRKTFTRKQLNQCHLAQSVLFSNNIDALIKNMKKFTIELSLWNSREPCNKLGSTHISWNHIFIDYLNKLLKKQDPVPPATVAEYNVFDEYNSRQMATIKLITKLRYIPKKYTSELRPMQENFTTFSEENVTTPRCSPIQCASSEILTDLVRNPGVIKTIYRGGKTPGKKTKNKKIQTKPKNEIPKHETEMKTESLVSDEIGTTNKINKNFVGLVRSDSQLSYSKHSSKKCRSLSSIEIKEHFSILRYIFGDINAPFRRQYCVHYFTVENDQLESSTSAKSSPKSRSPNSNSKTDNSRKVSSEKFVLSSSNLPRTVKACDKTCICAKKSDEAGSCACQPTALIDLYTPMKCKNFYCKEREEHLPSTSQERILIDVTNLKPIYGVTQKVEEVAGGVKGKLKFGDDANCFCDCECTFGFTKKTTYCSTCGGYEVIGEELIPNQDMPPFPCPIFHKLVDKNKMKPVSTTGSDKIKPLSATASEIKKKDENQKSPKLGAKMSVANEKLERSDKKSVESDKDAKKGKKFKKDDRFKFNYGYKGIPPQIGHSKCALPCSGTMDLVPRNMGWMWTADNIPGLKFRPNWKPGATNKHVVRMLKIARDPGQITSKRKVRDTGKKKKPLKRPLLIVHKKDGEYTVTMETMKTFNKPRAPNQHPYEDKPLVTYTIGRTEEENRERQKRKARQQRRLEREQRAFIQNTFKDVCNDICLKTYQQALGILPDAENPPCPCFPAEPGAERVHLDLSCSCSEETMSMGSATDDDEWIVEFTPPNAYFNPAYKCKKVLKLDASTQYTYMDYKVKLLDRTGNPIPRFFTGPDGKQQCSDLGGFWGPGKTWLEINVDGYIGPDGRWAPNSFIGPSGEQVDAETGKFQATNLAWLVVGVDGYVDAQGKWQFYPAGRVKMVDHNSPEGTAKITGKGAVTKPSEATWSCFGDVSPRGLSHMGIVGHGHDRKLLLDTLEKMLAQGEDVVIPKPYTIPHGSKRSRLQSSNVHKSRYDFEETLKCKHRAPSDKGIVAVDAYGNKTYFRLTDRKHTRPRERLTNLAEQGISLSSFHVPCFSSFINSEIMKHQQYEHLLKYSKPQAMEI